VVVNSKIFCSSKKNMEVLDETNMNKSFCNIVNKRNAQQNPIKPTCKVRIVYMPIPKTIADDATEPNDY
jgi:hypothetical protein